MGVGPLGNVVQHIGKLVAAEQARQFSDGELLELFARDRDQSAFAALVGRHGAMVLNVCRRILHNDLDAQDAYQAAFLVLVQKARSIRKKNSVGSWLHGVARRAATNLRKQSARRRVREQQVAVRPEQHPADVSWREMQTILDDEIQRLPERLSTPLVLCYLEGKTHDEAAQQLGWKLTTFRGRLERARELLRKGLTRRGVTLSAALLATALAETTGAADLPATLLAATLKAAIAGQPLAAGVISARAATLARGVTKSMMLRKLRIATVLIVAIGLAGVGGSNLADRYFARDNIGAKRQVGGGVPKQKSESVQRERGGARNEMTLAGIIAHVRRNERFYDNIEVVMHQRMTSELDPP
jgi:RNA polymerase sigma factor (sigma-70 family)